MPTFALDLSRFAGVAKDKADLVVRKVALETLSGVVMMTPVDTGRARGNWMVTIGSPAEGDDWEKYDPNGQGTIAEGFATIEQAIAGGPSIWIANNLPYINRLEYDAWSRQAPQGMVRVTLARLNAAYGKGL